MGWANPCMGCKSMCSFKHSTCSCRLKTPQWLLEECWDRLQGWWRFKRIRKASGQAISRNVCWCRMVEHDSVLVVGSSCRACWWWVVQRPVRIKWSSWMYPILQFSASKLNIGEGLIVGNVVMTISLRVWWDQRTIDLNPWFSFWSSIGSSHHGYRGEDQNSLHSHYPEHVSLIWLLSAALSGYISFENRSRSYIIASN